MKKALAIIGIVVAIFGTAFLIAEAPSVFAAPFPYAVGGTGTTTPNIGQVTYWGTSNLKGIGTTTASCSGGASCSSFTILGSTPVTITASGSSGTVSTSSSETSGRVPFWTSNSATPALLSGGSSNFTWDNTNNILSALHFLATGSSTLQAFTATNSTTTNATSTSEFATVASSTSLFTTAATVGTFNGANLSTCNGSNFLQWSSGLFACGTPSGGSTFGKTWEIVSGWLTPTTTIGVNLQSTGTTYGLGIENKLLGYASSTNSSTIFGLNAGGQVATTSSSGSVAATAFGNRALRGNIGLANSAFGNSALDTFGTALGGSFNTAVGYGAGAGINYVHLTSLGYLSAGGSSGTATSTGSTVIGSFAGTNMGAASDYNTLLGYKSGNQISTGYGNILIGPSVTNSNLTTGFGNIGVGYNTFFPTVSTNSTLNIGGLLFGTLPATTTAWTLPTTGGIGIGSSSPYALLSIHANGGSTYPALFAIGSSTSAATTTLFVVDSQGNVGISSTTPQAKLSVGSGTASSSISVAEYSYGKAGNNGTTTAPTLSPRTSNTIKWPLGASATTITLCNFQPGDTLKVIVTNPNQTAGAITWAACSGYQLQWAGGTTPTQTTTANKRDVWSFIADDNTGSSTPGVVTILGAQSANF